MTQNHCHTHNLVDDSQIDADRPWGIRVRLPATDPINKLIGSDWHKEHWYTSLSARETAFEQMRKRHGFYRIGDDPSQILERIDPAGE